MHQSYKSVSELKNTQQEITRTHLGKSILLSLAEMHKLTAQEMGANQDDDIFLNAIESAKKHNIKLKPGVRNEASGNCSYEAVIHNINYRSCFREKLPFSFDYYRRILTTDMPLKLLRGDMVHFYESIA